MTLTYLVVAAVIVVFGIALYKVANRKVTPVAPVEPEPVDPPEEDEGGNEPNPENPPEEEENIGEPIVIDPAPTKATKVTPAVKKPRGRKPKVEK